MLQVNFIMIYIIHKISVLLKITRILRKTPFKECNIVLLFKKKKIFFTTCNYEKFKEIKI